MAKIDKPLKYDANRIIGVHGLKRNKKCDILDRLTSTTGTIEDKYKAYLEHHQKNLDIFSNYWDDSALNMHFLAPVLYVAQLYEDNKIDVFFKRNLSWEFDGKVERVICDCLLAKPFGIYAPQVPYFFLQEFKKQKQNEDAEGQMLLAMLISQQENANGKPIFGCYLQGRFWVFTTLHDKNYCVSRAYDATQTTDLHQIIFMLRALKQLILTDLSV
jgi:hypothetical protein